MKIAYIILAHKLPDQLVRLVNKISTPDTFLIIHVDKKTNNGTYREILEPLKDRSDVFFLEREICNWGEFGHLSATLSGIREICENKIKFDYLLLITGQDYPIKSNENISQVLKMSNGKSYLNFSPLMDLSNQRDWLIYWHFHWLKRHYVFPRLNMFSRPNINLCWNVVAKRISVRRKLPEKLVPFYGGAYWCLSFDCIKYLFDYVNRNRNIVNFFRFTFIPEEIFFQTILVNSELKASLIDDDLRYIDFSEHKAHPALLGKDHYDRFINTHNIFARKFDSSKDTDVLDLIDQATR